MNEYKNEFLNKQEKIKDIKKCINPEVLNDIEYKIYWGYLNILYKYMLIFLKNYLKRYEGFKYNEYGLKTDEYLILLTFVNNCIDIGTNTGYYNNKLSRKLLKLDLNYYNMNKSGYVKKVLNIKD